MDRRLPLLRAIAVMPAGAYAVHQLRYLLAYGAGADHALARQGHGYLGSAAPYLLAPLAAALGAFVGRLARAWGTGNAAARSRPRLLTVWAAAAVALIALFAIQETLEGLLAAGHPPGLAGIVGGGGWLAIPAAAAVAAAIALTLRGADAMLTLLAGRSGRPGPRIAEPVFAVGETWTGSSGADVLAGCAASRAPPARLVSNP